MLTQRAPILWPDAIPDSPVPPPYMNMYSEIDHLTQSCAWKNFQTVHSGNELDGRYVRGHDSDGTVPLTCIQYCFTVIHRNSPVLFRSSGHWPPVSPPGSGTIPTTVKPVIVYHFPARVIPARKA